MAAGLERFFINLRKDKYRITSPPSRKYNCIAWAAGEAHRPWWPVPPSAQTDAYWPEEVEREETVQCFVRAFVTRGYEVCDDGRFEQEYEKVAIYADSTGTPTHMARQLPSGMWTSKLGKLDDIEHRALNALESPDYGTAVQFLKRPIKRA